ncbi:hypothetical protein A1OE_395 [Candidatus Endolissoclinum faulkneri L2]|uniref:Uncharacterized protein n=1 Tax=Candidatus Endolissoclinum faulkneri L2 TaxID=1193729 RepID=K7YPT8_9PROT|nr:hypothetical protein A1OE_395 [Candidatus Endolissoclinum faulkneri L2]
MDLFQKYPIYFKKPEVRLINFKAFFFLCNLFFTINIYNKNIK